MAEQRRSWTTPLCWLTVLLEGFDLVTLGATSLALQDADGPLRLTPGSLTVVATLSLVGVALGAAFIAPLADSVGRRKVLLGSVIGFSVFTLVQPLSPNVEVFGGLRLIAGLGLGACMPVALATMAEHLPAAKRARSSTTTMTGYHCGAVGAALLALAAGSDWHVLYYGGGVVGLVLAGLIWWKLPETAVAASASGRSGHRVAAVELLRPPSLRTTLAVWVATFMGLVLVYGLNTWMPNLMRSAGYDVSTAVTILLVLNAGGVLGMLLAGRVADGRGITPTVLLWFGVGGALLALLSIRFTSSLLLNVAIFATGLFVFSAQVLVYAYIAHTHPPQVRGSALGLASGVGRVGAIVGPLVTGVLVSSGLAYPWGFYVFSLAAVLGLLAMLVAPRASRGGGADAEADDASSADGADGADSAAAQAPGRMMGHAGA